jgi:hypothetical protein
MKRVVLSGLVVLVGLAVALVPSGQAGAGGFAVTTLDPLPAITPDEPATVGFTIRQHGVTPVALDGVRLMVRPVDGGSTTVFNARAEGPLGHYVADVVVPAGTSRWEVIQGMFGPQDLGPLVVATGGAATPSGGENGRRWPEAVRYGLLALTVLSAVIFVGALAGFPRSRRRPAAA